MIYISRSAMSVRCVLMGMFGADQDAGQSIQTLAAMPQSTLLQQMRAQGENL